MTAPARPWVRWLGVAAVIGGAYLIGQSLVKSPALGKKAAGFDLPIVVGEGTGQRVTLSSMSGRVVVLDFWASWCEACKGSVPMVNSVRHSFAGQDVTFVGVNAETLDGPALHKAHDAFGMHFGSVQDRDGSLAHAFGVRMLPALVVIDRRGFVKYVSAGVPRRSELTEAIQNALGS